MNGVNSVPQRTVGVYPRRNETVVSSPWRVRGNPLGPAWYQGPSSFSPQDGAPRISSDSLASRNLSPFPPISQITPAPSPAIPTPHLHLPCHCHHDRPPHRDLPIRLRPRDYRFLAVTLRMTDLWGRPQSSRELPGNPVSPSLSSLDFDSHLGQLSRARWARSKPWSPPVVLAPPQLSPVPMPSGCPSSLSRIPISLPTRMEDGDTMNIRAGHRNSPVTPSTSTAYPAHLNALFKSGTKQGHPLWESVLARPETPRETYCG